MLAIALRPIGLRRVNTCTPRNRITWNTTLRAIQPSMSGGMCPFGLPDSVVGWVCRDLQRDVGARVPDADDEHATVPQLRRVPVLAGVQLDDRRIEVGRERRDPRVPVRARRHDDVRRLERAIAGGHDVAVASRRTPSTRTPVRTGSSNRAAYASR